VSDEPPIIAPGESLAPGYTVVSHLSRADALDVYDVWSDARGCGCVAKVLRPDRRTSKRARARLVREGDILLGLAHPHLVRAYESFETRTVGHVVVLETLQGETLSHLIRRSPRGLSAVDVCHLGLHLASAVGYLHRHDVVHLDLKPSNVIAHAGMAKVIDLSLARPPGPVPVGVGTREYLSPEQARGGEARSASDVWGIGATLYAAATGKRPFEAMAEGYQQLQRRASPVAEIRPRYPREIRAALDACMEPDPADRPTLPDLVEVFADHVRMAA
jgi:serine/threonine protein kinase